MKKGTGLRLEIELQKEIICQNQPLPIKVTLVNSGEEAIMVNKRMALGYKDSLAREIYAIIFHEDTQTQASFHSLDINRNFSSAKDFQLLKPNNSISTTFDLFELYQFMKPGKYWIKFFYEAAEPLANVPENVFRETVESIPISLEILPGTLKMN